MVVFTIGCGLVSKVAHERFEPVFLLGRVFDGPIKSADCYVDFNIFTVPIDDDRGIRGVRVSPNLYSTMEDINKFLDAMLKIAA